MKDVPGETPSTAGADARAPEELHCNKEILKDAVGGGADRDTRGRVFSPEGFSHDLGEELGQPGGERGRRTRRVVSWPGMEVK